MPNRAYLFNTSVPVCKRAQLDEVSVRDGSSYVEVAQGVDQVPAIWFFCFSKEDLIPAVFSFRQHGRAVQQEVLLPCVRVEKAVRNLTQARVRLEAFVGDRTLVEDYRQAAIESLSRLALPFLVMDPTEVFLLNDPEEDARIFVTALQGGEAAFGAIRQLSFYEELQPPYAYKEFMSGGALEHRGRWHNSAALLGGFVAPPAVAFAAEPLPVMVPVAPDFTQRVVPSITVKHVPSSFSFDADAARASVRRACGVEDSHEKRRGAKQKAWWKIW